MKYIIAALLSVVLIWTSHVQATPINNSTVTKSKPVQVAAPEKVAKVQSDTPKEQEAVVTSEPLSDKEQLMQQAGIDEKDWAYVDYVIHRESSWNPSAVNYLGCIGLYQACPTGNKPVLLANCPDWQTNIVCSLKEASNYAVNRYGSWYLAFATWQKQGWW
jgi:hypothetical protein